MKIPGVNTNPEIGTQPNVEQKPQAPSKPKAEPKQAAPNDELLNLLKETTEPKHATPTPQSTANTSGQPNAQPGQPRSADPGINPEHFSSDPNAPQQPNPAAAPQVPFSTPEKQATGLIAFVDGIDNLFLPYAYQWAIFTDKEKNRLKELQIEIDNTEADKDGNQVLKLSKKDLDLWNKYQDYKKLKANIPFKKPEIDLMHTPLADIIRKYNIQIGPEMLLMGALFTVMTPRVMPLFSKMGGGL